MTIRLRFLLPWAAILSIPIAIHAALGSLPYLAESWSYLDLASRFHGPLDAFSPAIRPFRPLQHVVFWLAWDPFGADPALARLPALGLHLANVVLVAATGRRLGLSPCAATAAAGLFACFPNVQPITWVVGVGDPGRTLFFLLGLWLILTPGGSDSGRKEASPSRTLPRRRWARVAGLLACCAGAMAFKESGIVLVAAAPLWILTSTEAPMRRRLAGLLEARRDPLVLAPLVLATGFAIYVGFVRDVGVTARLHNALQPAATLAANAIHAPLAFLPEALRAGFLAMLHGALGTTGRVAAAATWVAAAGGMLLVLRRATTTGRFLFVLIVLDLCLPVLFGGFERRHAYLASALLPIALTRTLPCRLPSTPRGWIRVGLLLILAVAWLADTRRDAAEFRASGDLVARVLDRAEEERKALGPGRPIVVLDLPAVAGADQDIAVLNYGFREALALRGDRGRWILWRTRPYHTSSASKPVSPKRLARARQSGRLGFLRYDPARRTLVTLPPPP